MRSLNKVFLMGHLGQTPSLQIAKSGKPYCRLNLATNQSWMNADDQREQRTEWHSVFVWGTSAERCVENLKQGAMVFVEGSLNYWQAGEQKDYKNAIYATEVKFLNRPRATIEADFDDGLDNSRVARNHNAVAHPA